MGKPVSNVPASNNCCFRLARGTFPRTIRQVDREIDTDVLGMKDDTELFGARAQVYIVDEQSQALWRYGILTR